MSFNTKSALILASLLLICKGIYLTCSWIDKSDQVYKGVKRVTDFISGKIFLASTLMNSFILVKAISSILLIQE